MKPEQFKQLRLKNHVTILELSRVAKVSAETIRQFEKGEHRLPQEAVENLARVVKDFDRYNLCRIAEVWWDVMEEI